MHSRVLITASSIVLVAVIAGCSSPAASTAPASRAPASQAPVSQAPASQAPASQAPASQAPVSQAPASQAPASAAAGATVDAKPVGTIGTVLVAGSNGMTVYHFTMDTKDSGTSACTGNCIKTWPALTVAAGASPVAGAGVTGTLGTITRADDGTLQVTYNGVPLYFFANDKVPGDALGVYQNWEAVKP